MQILRLKGIDIMSTNTNGSNALHIAVKRGNKEAVEMLVDIKFPMNIPKNNGITALGIAAYKGNADIVLMLI
jgi:ankyrin repeat protein